MECNNVQDERPSSSTSGGQSGAGVTVIGVVDLVDFLADRKSVKELQVRQLSTYISLIHFKVDNVDLRFAIWAKHDTFLFLRYRTSRSQSTRRFFLPCIVCHGKLLDMYTGKQD